MKIIIYCSQKYKLIKLEPFNLTFDDNYAQRFIQHLEDNPNLCSGCGQNCVQCRRAYQLDYSRDIAGIYKFPSQLPFYVDNPLDYLPTAPPKFDIFVAINTHEEILLCLPDYIKRNQGKGLIVPVEDPDWLSNWAKMHLESLCKEQGIEFNAPKPFCALQASSNTPFINLFIDHFKIGKPKVELKIDKNKIKNARVKICAPCGNTIFVAHNIKGHSLDKDLHDWVAKYWHSYPCIASMKYDEELADTILHQGGYLHYQAFDNAIKIAKQKTSQA